jgi:hypothetical protein
MKFLKTFLKHAPDTGTGAPQSAAQQNVQAAVAAQPRGAENRRKLSTANYASNTNVVIDIPRDTSVKRMILSLVGAFTVTFSSGSPTLSPFGVFARICPNFYVVADGSRNIKVLDLYMQRCMNAMTYGTFPRRAYAKGATLQGVNDFASTEWLAGTIAYPTTTQDIIINEQLVVDFENPNAWQNKDISQLYTRNLQSCNMTFGFSDISNLQTTGVGATVTYSNVALSIVPTIIENREGTLAQGAFDFNEFVIRRSYSSQQQNTQILLNAGNKIVGIALMAQNGDSALSLADNVLTDINLLTNGVLPQQGTRFRDLSNDNKARNGICDDQYASSLRGNSGFAWMSLLKNGDALSGLDTALANGISTCELQVSTGPASGLNAVTYTAPIGISVLQQQIVPVPVKS